MESDINCVQNLLNNRPPTYEDKLLIKKKGRPTPDLCINYTTTTKTRIYSRVFNKNVYSKYEWMCGCPVTNKLFCFVCLLFKNVVTAWTKHGVGDLKHVAERAKKHENSAPHINACIDFNVMGKVAIREQLNSAYLQHKLKYNEEVEKNRRVLRRLIMCVKFCGAFELALRSHDENTSSENLGIYKGLIDFATELDSVLAIHLKNSKVFKGASKIIQNELLDTMLEIYKQEVINEIKRADFISLEANETSDTSNQQQMVIIVRYVFNQQICERLWSFISPARYTADALAKTLLDELQLILSSPTDNAKLISQSYDGASVMSDRANGVQAVIRRTFPHAHFVHSYAHEFNLLMERAAQCYKNVKIFFANLQSFAGFFARSPKHIATLDEVANRRLLCAPPARWNLKNRIVNTLFEYQDCFQDCLESIIDKDGVDKKTISEASSLLKHLNCPDFLYWLKIFHFIMPNVELLFNQAQMHGTESSQMQDAVAHFQQQIIQITSSTDNDNQGYGDEEEPAIKKQKVSSDGENRIVVTQKVCDTILTQIQDRFEFKDHLSAANLFASRNFKTYRRAFPQEELDTTVKSYPMLDGMKLKSELTTIYERNDMSDAGGVLSFLVFISDNNMKTVFTETYKLLDIICTTPMPTNESERCFSTLKRIKTFLRSTISEDRLNALAVLSIEKNFIQASPDFDNKVIDAFCNKKHRRTDFMYK